jgi:hypothetical protein
MLGSFLDDGDVFEVVVEGLDYDVAPLSEIFSDPGSDILREMSEFPNYLCFSALLEISGIFSTD